MTTSATAQSQTQRPLGRIGGGPTRSVVAASWTALGALLLRDLVVLRKHLPEFVLRTIIQPFLLCFVFLYVFPKIGQGVGGGSGRGAESEFATILVPGVVGISIMFQGVQSIALAMAQEFGFIILPITFLGGTYYSWTKLAPVKIGAWHWLQTVVLVNPLIYINDGMRAAFTDATHMHLYIIYPAIVAFSVIFLALGLRNFRRKVLA